MFPAIERDLDHNVSVANFPSKVFTLKYLSTRYRLDIGKMAEQTSRYVVARNVALARDGPIPKCSARQSAVICWCLLWEMYA